MSDLITLAEVKSRNVRGIGYHPEKRQLHVQFDNGIYVSAAVPPEVHEALMAAESKGGYLHQHVRGKFKHGKA